MMMLLIAILLLLCFLSTSIFVTFGTNVSHSRIIPINDRQRSKREVDKNKKIESCKQHHDKCRKLINDVLTITNGNNSNISQVERVIASLLKAGQEKKLKRLNFCLNCRQLEVEGQISYDEGSNEKPTNTFNRDIYDVYPMLNGVQPHHISIPIPFDVPQTTSQPDFPRYHNGNTYPTFDERDPKMQILITKTNNTKLLNGVKVTNILKNTTIIEKSTTEGFPNIDQAVQTEPEFEGYPGYLNIAYPNIDSYLNPHNYGNVPYYPNPDLYNHPPLHTNIPNYQNSQNHLNNQNYANNHNHPNTGIHPVEQSYNQPHENQPIFSNGPIYANRPHQNPPNYHNGPIYQTTSGFSNAPLYHSGPINQQTPNYEHSPYFQVAPEIPLWNPPMGITQPQNLHEQHSHPQLQLEHPSQKIDSGIRHSNQTSPHIRIQVFPPNITRVTFPEGENNPEFVEPCHKLSPLNSERTTEKLIEKVSEKSIEKLTYRPIMKSSTETATERPIESTTSDDMARARIHSPTISMDNHPPGSDTDIFQPSGNPTAETISVSQQVQIAPSVTWIPYPVCFYGPRPDIPLSRSFPIDLSHAATHNNRQQVDSLYLGRKGPNFELPKPLPALTDSQFQNQYPPIQHAIFDMSSTQLQKIGPTGPGQNELIVPKSAIAHSSPNVPYYCTYIPAPTFQYPSMPGITDSQRSAELSWKPMNLENCERNKNQCLNKLNEMINHQLNDNRSIYTIWARENDALISYCNKCIEERKKALEIGNSGETTENSNARFVPLEVMYPDCPPGNVKCRNGIMCIPRYQWCNGKIDCDDASDEQCSCKDRISELRLCDGYFDCPHGEDELGCAGCPANFFNCEDPTRRLQDQACVPLIERCDGVPQCTNSKDENDCSIISDTILGAPDVQPIGYTSGYLQRNVRGQWYPVCSISIPWAREACFSETGPGKRSLPALQEVVVQNFVPGPFIMQNFRGTPDFVSTCYNKAIHVQCPLVTCGTSVGETVYSQHYYRRNTDNGTNPDEKLIGGEGKNGGLGRDDPIVGVVGGRASKPQAWPFIVALYRDGNFHCGGAILNELWTLTASHCVDNVRHYYEIHAGLLRQNSFSPMTQVKKARRIVLHPLYDKTTMRNDIALILLDTPLRFNRWVRPVCIPEYLSNLPKPMTTCITVGWGATIEHGPDPDQLREVEVPILRECKHLPDRNDGTICAGYPGGGKDACQGDSGGPLLCRNLNSGPQWYVSGIVSHGEGCARPGEPGVYTKVAKYTPWIQGIIGAPSSGLGLIRPKENCPGFRCKTGVRNCISERKRCNGVADCLGAEDELDCHSNVSFRESKSQTQFTKDLLEPITQQYYPETNYTAMTTVRNIDYHDNDTNIPLGDRFSCGELDQIIPLDKRCDGSYDCEDGTDETNCTCRDSLARVSPSSICNGNIDCFDGSDENDCELCNNEQYHCRRSGSCINKVKRCDKIPNCQLNEDELDCVTLSNGEYVNLDHEERPHLNSEGVLTQFVNGAWNPVCYHASNSTANMALNICQYLGFRYLDYAREIKIQMRNIPERKEVNDYEYPPPYRVPNKEVNRTCSGLYIRCKSVLSSPVNSHLSIRQPSQERIYQWPWQGAILTDGQYRCPAILLETNWLLSSSRCCQAIDLASNYTIAVLGVPSYNPKLYQPHQQVIEVNDIRNVKNSESCLFHLKQPLNVTRHVQPIFNEKRIFPPTLNDTCVAVGVNSEYVHKNIFLKPVLDCPKCHRCYINKEQTYCLNHTESRDLSGIVSCLGPAGWYPSGVFQEQNSICSFNKTEVIIGIDYMNAHIFETMGQNLRSVKGPSCDGRRCRLGKCISWNKICDGIKDCEDEVDEQTELCGNVKERCLKNGIGCNCAVNEMRCGDGSCIPKEKFCDSSKDCSDGSDEPAVCNCAAYLKLTAPERICDSKRDCFDKTDENPQFCKCKDASFQCGRADRKPLCISHDMVCDEENDCPGGEDEAYCRRIFGSLKDRNGTGEVLRQSFGVWHSECFPTPVTSQTDAVIVCQLLGFQTGIIANSTERENEEPMVPVRDEFFTVKLNDKVSLKLRSNKPFVTLGTPKGNCHRLFVQCV